MQAILQHIATPLQLVALFLLLVAGIARLLARSGKLGGSPQITKLVINRLFAAALVALALGVLGTLAAPMLDRWLNGDETFHGVVLSATGDPVPGASVNLLSIAMATTNPVGQFEIVVPRNRVAKDYRVQVKASGFKIPDTVTKTDADMRTAEFRLTPAPPALVKDLAPRLFVGQFFGMPFVIATFRVENTAANQQNINEIRGTLIGPGGNYTLLPMSWTIINAFGPYMPVYGPFPITAGARLDLRVVLMPASNLNGVMAKVNALPPYRTRMPCTPSNDGKPAQPLTDEAYGLLASFAQDHFAWQAGPWQVQLGESTDNEDKSFQRNFVLTPAEVAQLRQSFPLMKQCLGVNIGSPLGQDASMANFIEKGP